MQQIRLSSLDQHRHKQMDAFMKERIALYIEGAQRLGLGKK